MRLSGADRASRTMARKHAARAARFAREEATRQGFSPEDAIAAGEQAREDTKAEAEQRRADKLAVRDARLLREAAPPKQPVTGLLLDYIRSTRTSETFDPEQRGQPDWRLPSGDANPWPVPRIAALSDAMRVRVVKDAYKALYPGVVFAAQEFRLAYPGLPIPWGTQARVAKALVRDLGRILLAEKLAST